MQTYTIDDLNNLNSSEKQTVLAAERTFITFGEGAAQTAFKLSDVLLVVKGLADKQKVKAPKEKKAPVKKAPAKRSKSKKKK